MASNAENVSTWWRHHINEILFEVAMVLLLILVEMQFALGIGLLGIRVPLQSCDVTCDETDQGPVKLMWINFNPGMDR